MATTTSIDIYTHSYYYPHYRLIIRYIINYTIERRLL